MESERLAIRLKNKFDIRPGDSVLVCLANSFEHLVLIFAIWKLKAEFHSLAPSSSDALLAGLFNRGAYKFICIDHAQEERLLTSVQGLLYGDDCISVRYTADSEVKIYSRESTKIKDYHSLKVPDPESDSGSWLRDLEHQRNCTFFTSA